MLVSLSDMKTYLGISAGTYDTFLTEQLQLISDVVEAYCRRKFESAVYDQTFYSDDHPVTDSFRTFHYPVITLTSITQDAEPAYDPTTYRVHKPTGTILRNDGFFWGVKTVVRYTAGFAVIPTPIQAVVKTLVQERYNKKVSGVNLSFGSDVQRVSIPGAISIDFDYSLSNNERTSHFGSILGSQINILDSFRSERAIIGSGSLEFVEVVP